MPEIRRWPWLLGVLTGALLAPEAAFAESASPEPGSAVTFRNDVMAVLSKAGCNAGTCHGNRSGKGGFKLSLRGEDPQADLATLTRDAAGRRVNPLDPDSSLLLLKPTMQVPHEGGRRFDVDSPEYRILRRWIGSGLPADPPATPVLVRLDVSPTEAFLVEPVRSLQVQAVAHFSDGRSRDVTRLAVYEVSDPKLHVTVDGIVTCEGFGEATLVVRFLNQQQAVRLAFVPRRPGFVWQAPEPANYVDEYVFAKLKRLRINPSPVCDDTTFVRRAYLDLLGILPTADEARRFVADKSPEKRRRLVETLLERPEFADYWALKWSDLLRNEEKTLDRKGVQHFHQWIRHAIAEGMPMDRFVRELIVARGSTYAHPPANFYRALREPTARAESTAQVFLGIRLQCAKCHNHPFDRWTQDDYYGWANLFARIDYKIVENRRRDRNDKHEFDGEQIVFPTTSGDVINPRTGRPAALRLLGEGGNVAAERAQDRLALVADWLTSSQNERFARTMVNRIWFHLMGRGLVDPIDDFRATNPPSHPELLEELADDFVAHGFDLRHVVRTITASRTWQLSAQTNSSNADDTVNYSHALVRRLPAETLLDALAQVCGRPVKFNGYPLGIRAGQLAGVRAVRLRDAPPTAGDQFLRRFGKPPRLQSCECERSDEITLDQTFELASGPLLDALLQHPDNRLAALLASNRSDQAIIEELFWTALSRPPSATERSQLSTYLQRASNRRAALEDIVWGLVTSTEFMLRH